MSDNVTKSDLLTHASEWKDRLNKAREEFRDEIEKERHRAKNQEQALLYDISENKEHISLLQQWQEFMKEKVNQIEKHLSDWISDIKNIIEKQSSSFVTKSEYKNSEARLSRIEKGFLWVIGLFATAIIWAIINLIIKTWNI